jgi:hypothetical protein
VRVVLGFEIVMMWAKGDKNDNVAQPHSQAGLSGKGRTKPVQPNQPGVGLMIPEKS